MEDQEKKEIDLLDIFRVFFKYIRLFFCKIIDILVWLLRFMFKEKWILIVAVLLGIGYSFYISRPSNLVYQGKVEMRFNMFDAYFYKDMINRLTAYCVGEDPESLAQVLDISLDEAAAIASVNSYFYIDILSNGTPDKVDYAGSFKDSDTINSRMADRLMLVILSKDISLFPKYLSRMDSFLTNNPVIQKENIVRLKHIDESVSAIDNEIAMLDSLRKIEYFKKNTETRNTVGNTLLLSEKERKLYHNDVLSLENSKQRLQWEKEVNNSNIRFLNSFEIEPKPVNRITRTLIRYVPISFILGFFFALGWRYKKSIYDFLTEK
jgi:hypothetical protein